jgi:hypothetical protein
MYPRIRVPSLGLELALFLGSLTGCGGGTPPVQQFSMSVSPSPANAAAEATEQFSVKVTGVSSSAVTWQVNGVAGGTAAAGRITDAGLYTPTAELPHGYVAWALTTLFLQSSGHFNTDLASVSNRCVGQTLTVDQTER